MRARFSLYAATALIFLALAALAHVQWQWIGALSRLDEEHELYLPKQVGGYATEMSGTRHGRSVKLRLGVMPSIWRNQPATEVELDSPVTPFSVHADDGRMVMESGALPEVDEVLAELAESPKVWHDVVVEGVSLVNNYRSQFDRFLSKKSFDELLQVLREKKSNLS